jgi:hypothetical protein
LALKCVDKTLNDDENCGPVVHQGGVHLVFKTRGKKQFELELVNHAYPKKRRNKVNYP